MNTSILLRVSKHVLDLDSFPHAVSWEPQSTIGYLSIEEIKSYYPCSSQISGSFSLPHQDVGTRHPQLTWRLTVSSKLAQKSGSLLIRLLLSLWLKLFLNLAKKSLSVSVHVTPRVSLEHLRSRYSSVEEPITKG